MENRNATIRVFGQFRNYFKQAEIAVPVTAQDSLATLKARVAALVAEPAERETLSALLDHSVFATEARVLHPGDELPSNLKLALLPPVCGG